VPVDPGLVGFPLLTELSREPRRLGPRSVFFLLLRLSLNGQLVHWDPRVAYMTRGFVACHADTALARDPFPRQLGDEWQPEEPGMYRFVGGERSDADNWLDADAFELHARQKRAARTAADD